MIEISCAVCRCRGVYSKCTDCGMLLCLECAKMPCTASGACKNIFEEEDADLEELLAEEEKRLGDDHSELGTPAGA